MDRGPEQTFLQRGHTDESCSAPLIIKEMQMKNTMRYHLTPIEKTIINKLTNDRCLGGYEEKGNPYALLVGLQIGPATLENSMNVP